VTLLVTDKAAAEAASKVAGVSKVLVADSDALRRGIAEPYAGLVVGLQAKHGAWHGRDRGLAESHATRSHTQVSPHPPTPSHPHPLPRRAAGFTHVVGVATNAGKNVVPRAAVKMDVAPITDVTAVHGEDTFERPMYAGNAIAKVKSADKVKVLTVRPTAFEKAAPSGGSAAVEAVDAAAIQSSAPVPTWVKEEVVKSERPELASAPIVVAGGRALKSADNFKILYSLADRLGAAVGASRAAVDAGYVPNDMQVGQTGASAG
jgi:electron transfer flavoprotein alpha subunit